MDAEWSLVTILGLKDKIDALTRATGMAGSVQVRGAFNSKHKNYHFHYWVDVVGFGEVRIDLRKRPCIKVVDADDGSVVEVINAGTFNARVVR
jgi:hypothetical protein